MCSNRVSNKNILPKLETKQLTCQKRKKRRVKYLEIWVLALDLSLMDHVTLASHLNLLELGSANIFCKYVGHMVSVATAQFCHSSM